MKFLQLSDDLFVMPSEVGAVKRGLDDEHCVVFLKGQGFEDGFVIDEKAEDAVEAIEEALAAEGEDATPEG